MAAGVPAKHRRGSWTATRTFRNPCSERKPERTIRLRSRARAR
jgi:hypothetical protein